MVNPIDNVDNDDIYGKNRVISGFKDTLGFSYKKFEGKNETIYFILPDTFRGLHIEAEHSLGKISLTIGEKGIRALYSHLGFALAKKRELDERSSKKNTR